MTTIRRFCCDDLLRFSLVNLDHLTETVSFVKPRFPNCLRLLSSIFEWLWLTVCWWRCSSTCPSTWLTWPVGLTTSMLPRPLAIGLWVTVSLLRLVFSYICSVMLSATHKFWSALALGLQMFDCHCECGMRVRVKANVNLHYNADAWVKCERGMLCFWAGFTWCSLVLCLLLKMFASCVPFKSYNVNVICIYLWCCLLNWIQYEVGR